MSGGKNNNDDSSSKGRRSRRQESSSSNYELENMDDKNQHILQAEFTEDIRSAPSGSLYSEEKPHLKRALKARHVRFCLFVCNIFSDLSMF